MTHAIRRVKTDASQGGAANNTRKAVALTWEKELPTFMAASKHGEEMILERTHYEDQEAEEIHLPIFCRKCEREMEKSRLGGTGASHPIY